MVRDDLTGVPGDRWNTGRPRGSPLHSMERLPGKITHHFSMVLFDQSGQLFPVHQYRGVTLPVIGSFLFNLPPTLVCFAIDKIGNHEITSDGFPIQTYQRKTLGAWYPALHFQYTGSHEFFKFS